MNRRSILQRGLLLGTLGLLGGTVGRDYLVRFVRREAPQPLVDQRVPALLEQGRVALLKGDLEKAHGELAKASVLAEGDPRVAAELGRVEVARAELLWAQQRLNGALAAAKAEAASRTPQRRRKTEAELAAETLAANEDASEKKPKAAPRVSSGTACPPIVWHSVSAPPDTRPSSTPNPSMWEKAGTTAIGSTAKAPPARLRTRSWRGGWRRLRRPSVAAESAAARE